MLPINADDQDIERHLTKSYNHLIKLELPQNRLQLFPCLKQSKRLRENFKVAS